MDCYIRRKFIGGLSITSALPSFTYSGDFEIVSESFVDSILTDTYLYTKLGSTIYKSLTGIKITDANKTDTTLAKTVTMDEIAGSKVKNWKIRFLKTGDLVFNSIEGLASGIDIFAVGGGAGGGTWYGNNASASGVRKGGSGGGGGYTATVMSVPVNASTKYAVSIGAGGAGTTTATRNNGQPTYLAVDGLAERIISADGGQGKNGGSGGGSGGGPGTSNAARTNLRGSDGGNDGGDGVPHEYSYTDFGTGQKTTTREFGSPYGMLYSGGGGGGHGCETSGYYIRRGGDGGSGGGGRGSGMVYKQENGAWVEDLSEIAKSPSSNNNSAKTSVAGVHPASGEANTGGGGGGAGGQASGGAITYIRSGAGGSGILIIRAHRDNPTP